MSAEHEAKCRRCGRCCQLKTLENGVPVLLNGFCMFFDAKTRLCRNYKDRLSFRGHCVGVRAGTAAHAFPADCPYVAGIPGYREPEGIWIL